MIEALPGIVLRLAVVVLSLAVHEAAHGLVARWLGDPTATRQGRVSLNPLRHLDLQGSVIVPGLLLVSQWLAGGQGGVIFGWAKPVPVDPRYFRNPFTGMALVAAAGPASNLLLALAAAQLLEGAALAGFGWRDGPALLLAPVIIVNLALMIFNLIPLPPLDGSKMLWGPLFPFMPARFRHWYAGLTHAQRSFGPILLVVGLGLGWSLLGGRPWAWFNYLFGGLVFAAFQWLLVLTELSWSWL